MAVKPLKHQSFDLVLMDIQMPEMDGYEATKAIGQREQNVGGHIPIIAMTAHALKGDRERCLLAGMGDYLSKPIQPRVLAKIINSIAGPGQADPYTLVASPELTDVIDWKSAVELVGGSEDVLSELMDVFFEESAQILPALRDAISSGNTVEVHRLAHTMKVAVSCFAAGPAIGAALRLEMIGKEGELSDAADVCCQLEYEIDRLKEALSERLQF